MSLRLEGSLRRHPSTTQRRAHDFAHPSEVTFSRLLDLYEIRWVYEPTEFPLSWHTNGRPSAAFRPDFYLPDFGEFLELTTAEGRLATRKNAKIRRFRALYPEVALTLIGHRQFGELCERHRLQPNHPLAA